MRDKKRDTRNDQKIAPKMVKCESWTENTKANSFGGFRGNLSRFL